MERSARGMFAGGSVVGVVRKIVIHKVRVILQQAFYTLALLNGCLCIIYNRVGLYRFTPFLPFFVRFFFGQFTHSRLNFCTEQLHDVLVLVLVHHLAELRRNFGVGRGLIFEPFTECHKALYEINHRSFFVELVNRCR